jgi:hypothetical protein
MLVSVPSGWEIDRDGSAARSRSQRCPGGRIRDAIRRQAPVLLVSDQSFLCRRAEHAIDSDLGVEGAK